MIGWLISADGSFANIIASKWGLRAIGIERCSDMFCPLKDCSSNVDLLVFVVSDCVFTAFCSIAFSAHGLGALSAAIVNFFLVPTPDTKQSIAVGTLGSVCWTVIAQIHETLFIPVSQRTSGFTFLQPVAVFRVVSAIDTLPSHL